MDQNRSENGTSQQQNVHLHMHHVCNCQGNVYPTYYPAVGYRTPVPPLVTYQAGPPVPRSYLQHYQYTQFNMGGPAAAAAAAAAAGQYSVPIAHHMPPPGAAGAAAAAYGGGGTGANPAGGEVSFGMPRERKEKAGSTEGNGDGSNEGIATGYDYNQVITPPASELLMSSDNSESVGLTAATPENFVKFLERSCLTAEQIAYRNRNRPCFRNIQNLCIRTRSEILKPCTTISNIHSQGIPWATKDFIYAFVRLTNCWHILKGYWENRDGSSLGKIEKELTPEFRACYVRWEKETIELAAQLTRVFYNLDTNLVSPQTNSVKTSPPMTAEVTAKKCQSTGGENSISTSTLTNISIGNAAKNVRGIIHLPPSPVAVPITVVTETADQANQTYSGDFCKEEGYDSEEERRVYMKPGSYNVPKKESNEGGGGGGNNATNSPRAIEFLETAQNINKAHTMANDRYWSNLTSTNTGASSAAKKPATSVAAAAVAAGGDNIKLISDMTSESELELNLTTHMNVHEWILNSNFSDFGEPSPLSTSTQDLRPFFGATPIPTGELETTTTLDATSQPITVLQRAKATNGVGKEEVCPSKPRTSTPPLYEDPSTSLTPSGVHLLSQLLHDLKKYDVLEGLEPKDKTLYSPSIDLDSILAKLGEYRYVSEVVRDLKYLIGYYNRFAERFVDQKKKELVVFITEMFALKLREFLKEKFPECEFGDVSMKDE